MTEPPRAHRPAIVNGNDEGLPPIEYEVETITDDNYGVLPDEKEAT